MMTFAQNFEDVMLARLFPPEHRGFYIDVGAADPVYLSVTKHFYDQGWQGVNVEPLPRFFARLQQARARDANVNAIIGGGGGRHRFYEIEELPENSTSDEGVMATLKGEGRTVRSHEVDVVSLKQLCEQHVAGREIDFMKIDVEGGELEVLQSADWQNFRPVVLVIEAVVVNGRDETWPEWEHVVTEAGYCKVWFDGLNNFYLRQESMHLQSHFRLPPNVFDAIQWPRLSGDGQDLEDHATRMARLDADLQAKDALIHTLDHDLRAANADRVAKQEVVDRMIADLLASNADRVLKDEVIAKLSARVQALESGAN